MVRSSSQEYVWQLTISAQFYACGTLSNIAEFSRLFFRLIQHQKLWWDMRVAVIGAGAFGGWTALNLLRQGARVTLVDAWGPGHTRASSGGETRVIRASYGTRRIYTELAARAHALWREYDARWQTALLQKTGALWLFGSDDKFGHATADGLAAHGLAAEWLSPAKSAKRFPQFSYEGIGSALFEPDAGYLLARRACEHVAARLEAEGGTVRTGAVRTPFHVNGSPLKQIVFEDRTTIEADAFVFACGPWLGQVFDEVIGARIEPTRQEVYYFGTPAGDDRFSEACMPVWLDLGDRIFYGIPGNANRGFKIADDTPGERFDPTDGSREVSADGLAAARAFLARRFPALAKAPYLGGEVCQYEATPDSHFIVDRHPGASNVWIAGGGSGHGFKMGPALGELIAHAILNDAPLPPEWRLARFDSAVPSGDIAQQKWT
jgi:glycine/D-amino acid oxidase-like deaminating enzyme